MLALVGLALVVFLGVGYYLNWYSFASQPSSEGHQRFQIDVNSKKIGQDAQRGVEAASKKLQNLIDKDRHK